MHNIGMRLDKLPLSGFHWRLLGLIVGLLGAETKHRLPEAIAADAMSEEALEGSAKAAAE